jgi:hypothetical protein
MIQCDKQKERRKEERSKESTGGDKTLKRLTVEFSTGITEIIVRKEA